MSGNYNAVREGTWNVICQRCQFKVRSDVIRKEWTGLYVCGKCWEPRHPQDFVKGVVDDTSVPFSFPDSNESVTASDPNGGSFVGASGGITTLTDVDYIIDYNTDQHTVLYTGALTSPRTITFPNTLGVAGTGTRYTIHSNTTGFYFLSIVGGGLIYTSGLNRQEIITIEWTGTVWVVLSVDHSGV